ncbi:MAG TPA: hypothetical protein VNX18_18115 [Bryobacteraceae bacterium]|jgi:hypothetical protein|nr:hypothetical protein [Bryobacteraceae bacterium]
MNRILLGILLGLGCGVVDVLLMLPMTFPDKPTALAAAFSSRFAIGFIAANVTLPMHPALTGALVGLLISIPDAIVTKTYVPIIVTGLIFGALSGWAARTWAA